MTKVFILSLLLALTLMGCYKKFDTPTTDKRFFGTWVRNDSLSHNVPYFNLKSDGSFSETQTTDQINLNNLQQAESWEVYNQQLHLKYILRHKLLFFINRPRAKYINYAIKFVTDSSLTLIDNAPGGRPGNTIYLKKVKGSEKDTINAR